MTQTVLPPIVPPNPTLDIQIAAFAKRYRDARGLGMKLVSLLGGQADGLLARLPTGLRTQLDTATFRALEASFDAASYSRSKAPDTGHWLTKALTMGTGVAGGMGGLPTALAELPVTTTVILRAIQGIAAEHGFDPDTPDTRMDCLQVFAAAGPMAEDDDVDLSFLTLRMTVTGATVQTLLSTVAPRLAVVLGQKLAAQTVPVLGAVTGAGINYTFTAYYQEMAQIVFGLRKLAEQTGEDRAELIAQFERSVLEAK